MFFQHCYYMYMYMHAYSTFFPCGIVLLSDIRSMRTKNCA